MDPLPSPPSIAIYCLIKQDGMYFSTIYGSPISNIGMGFFLNKKEAEVLQMVETIKLAADQTHIKFHIFELDVPNPAYTQ